MNKKYINQDSKILFVMDLHLKSKEPRNRWNCVKESLEMFETIVDMVLIENINIVVLLGEKYVNELNRHYDDIYMRGICHTPEELHLLGETIKEDYNKLGKYLITSTELTKGLTSEDIICTIKLLID